MDRLVIAGGLELSSSRRGCLGGKHRLNNGHHTLETLIDELSAIMLG
ncbi:hypothetical protein [Desulfosarcina sp.]